MEDGQSPPDAEKRADSSGGGGRAPRAGLRLRDAEAVATTRRDMFGDGSLLDALAPQNASEPPLEAEPEPQAEARPQSQPQAQPEPQSQSQPEQQPQLQAQDEDPPSDASAGEPAPEVADAMPEPASEVSAESLDEIIDSFPAEPPPTDAAPASEPHADPSFLATSAFSFREPRLGKEPGEADQPPAAVFERYQVSAIFQSLSPDGGRPGPDPEAVPAAAEAPAHGADQDHQTPLPPSAVEAPAAEAPQQTQDAAAQDDVAEGDGTPAPADTSAGVHGLAPALDLNMWPPLPSASADAPDGSDGDQPPRAQATDPAPRATMPSGVSMPDLTSWPPFPEAPGTDAADAQAAGGHADAGHPSQGDDQFLGTPAWPPFPELPGGEADVPPTMPAGLPPYIELPATPEAGESDAADAGAPPAFAGSPEAEADSRYADDADAGPFARADDPYPGAHGRYQQARSAPPPSGRYPGDDRSAFAYPEGTDADMAPAPQSTFAPSQLDAAARASNEATAKIAAEANATAQALDNLQRLLNHSIPPPEAPPPAAARQGARSAPVSSPRTGPVSAPTGYHDASLSLRADPPAFRGGLERYLPLPLPSSGTDQGKRVYLLGFATGLVLSVVAGVALYILIALGN